MVLINWADTGSRHLEGGKAWISVYLHPDSACSSAVLPQTHWIWLYLNKLGFYLYYFGIQFFSSTLFSISSTTILHSLSYQIPFFTLTCTLNVFCLLAILTHFFLHFFFLEYSQLLINITSSNLFCSSYNLQLRLELCRQWCS